MVSLETKKWYAFSEYKVEKYGSASSENCWDTSELDNSVSWKYERQSLFFGRKTKEECIKTSEDYWLKRGLSLASLSLWKLFDYSWEPKHMPEELKELCEGELLVVRADEVWFVHSGPEDLKKSVRVFCWWLGQRIVSCRFFCHVSFSAWSCLLLLLVVGLQTACWLPWCAWTCAVNVQSSFQWLRRGTRLLKL